MHITILPAGALLLLKDSRQSSMKFTSLALFDIDGTLVRRAGAHHREALVYGVRRVTGIETTTEGIPVQGMLDPIIIAQMLRNAGAKSALIRKAMPEIQRAAERFYLRVCPALHDKHCPAVEPTLERLARRGALLGLVTGNLTRIGWRKLDRAGLKRHFRFGAFGEMAKTRAGLAKWAIAEARRKDWIDRATPVSLIGDATSDIVAAKTNGIRSISVGTGITPREELVALTPDYLLRSLRDLRLQMLGID
jgi:phosphoglycolate phosphatase